MDTSIKNNMHQHELAQYSLQTKQQSYPQEKRNIWIYPLIVVENKGLWIMSKEKVYNDRKYYNMGAKDTVRT